jgi:hypothetical protein
VPSALARFLAHLATTPAEAPNPALLVELQQEGGLDEALFRLKRLQRGEPSPGLPAWALGLEAAARQERVRRAALWHLGLDRIHLRLAYARGPELGGLNPSAMQALLTRVLEAAGLTPALSLEKRPRPMVTLGPPLPVDTSGLEEWADVVLARRPALPPETWPEAFDAAAPPGLCARRFNPVPAYATPLLDLAREAHWTWPCPPAWIEEARSRITSLMAASSFEITKGGRSEGQKGVKQVDIRLLAFTLRILPGEATHPRKLLGGILGRDPLEVTGLMRLSITLAPDPRAQQADRFEPKLRNIFEDAVALGPGSNLTLVDEDDDEPLRLG